MSTYTNCWPANGTVTIYASASTTSSIVGTASTVLSADDTGAASGNTTWIHVSSPVSGYAKRLAVNTAYSDNIDVSFFGGTGTSNQLQQSSTKKIPVINLQFALKRLGYGEFDPWDGAISRI